jgi:hypothetical protein
MDWPDVMWYVIKLWLCWAGVAFAHKLGQHFGEQSEAFDGYVGACVVLTVFCLFIWASGGADQLLLRGHFVKSAALGLGIPTIIGVWQSRRKRGLNF